MKKILLTLIILATIGIVHAQNVNIPDAIFKAVLVGNSAINTNGDSEIQVSEASAFGGTIFCASLGISDLTGIEAFTALTILNCSSNLITSLDVSQNIALTSLNCSGDGYVQGQITSLDVSLNTALTEFYCFENQLDSLNVSQNSALTTLWCYENDLDSLNVSQNPALTTLWCSNNQLTSLNLNQNTSLGDLNCAFNQLTYLDVANGNNTNMSNFYANNNPNLFCIDVDDVAWSTANWTHIDAWTSFSLNCNPIIYGCTNPAYCNYDSTATIDDGTCTNYCGCDSLSIYYDDSMCGGVGYYFWVYSSGFYTNGCFDDIGGIFYTDAYVFISNSSSGSSNVSICDSYSWDGVVYTTSGAYTNTYTNVDGCDSIHTLNLTINESNTVTTLTSDCDSYTWDGVIYTTSGAYTNTYTNVDGCDSIHTLNLTITSSPSTSIILGNTPVNYLSTEIYNVAQNIGSTFNWQLNGGGIIVAGQNTNSIQVQWGNNSGIYDLYVIETDSNGCIGDTIYLSITVNSTSNIENHNLSTGKKLIKITDVLGRKTKGTKQPLFYIYDDGTVEKRIIIE